MAVVLSTPAYLKIMLHASKHPHCPVNGLLLGQGSAADTLSVSDAVPLFHQHTLSPMLEAATTLAEQHCAEQGGGLKIVGYYHANERANDRELSQLEVSVGRTSDEKKKVEQIILLLTQTSRLPSLA